MSAGQSHAAAFAERLRGELRRARRAHLLAALPAVKIAQILVALPFMAILHFAPPSTGATGFVLSLLFWVMVVLTVSLALLWPLFRLPSGRRLLRDLEHSRHKSQTLETAADIASGRLEGRGYSKEIMEAVMDAAVSELGAGLPRPARSSPRLRMLAVVMVLAFLVLLFLPTGAGIRPIAFLVFPGDSEHYLEHARLLVEPGNLEVLAGSDVRLKALEKDLPWRFPGEVRLEIDETGDLFTEMPLRTEAAAHLHLRRDVSQAFSYRFVRGRTRSETYSIDIFYAPMLDSLTLSARPPAYTGLAEIRADMLTGELSLPVGSHISIKALSSSPLSEAWLLLDGDSLRLETAERLLSADLQLNADLSFALRLRDKRGTESLTPPLLKLRATRDRPPLVEILSPPAESVLNRNQRVVVDLAAADDYGVDRLALLAWQPGRPDSVEVPIDIRSADRSRISETVIWDLASAFMLFPGDIVEYRALAWDTNPDGPGLGKSRVHRLRLPSVTEFYERIEERDEDRQDRMRDLLSEGERQQEDLRRLEQELRADQSLDRNRREELSSALEKQRELAEQLDQLARDFAEQREEQAENELLRGEMNEKLEKIQELLEELRDTEAGEILERFQKMLDEMDPGEVADQLGELRLDQEQILEELERTQKMLERLMQEQKMDALLQQTDELIERQEELRAEAEAQSGDEDTEQGDLADRQDELAADSEALEEQTEKAASDMEEEFPEAAEKMREEQEKSPSESMREAAEQMRQEGENSAGEQQQDASRQLLKLYWRLAQSQGMMQSQMSMESMAGLERVTAAALELSLREEAVAQDIIYGQGFGSRLEANRAAARKQMGLYRVMEELRADMLEVARKTLSVSPVALRESRIAEEFLGRTVASLESGKLGSASNEAGHAITHINKAVVELLHGVQMDGQGGGSCSSPMQQMKDMLSRQEQLNRDSRAQRDQQGGNGMSLRDRAAMQRLKAEQQAIREGLGEMIGEEDELLGRLDQITEEMEKVERDLEGGRLTDETLRRQEEIFDRLLDAQRSVHRRDFKRERKSRSGENLAPRNLPEILPERIAKLREAIRHGLGDAAPLEYEALIREYYRALLELEAGQEGESP